MANVLLISEEEIKSQSIIEKNVDGKVLSIVIWDVQELQLKDVLGKTLYDNVLNKVREKAENNTEIDADTTELINDYITPFLINATLVKFIVVNNFKASNKGLMKLTDNTAQTATAQDFQYIVNYYENQLASYKARLVAYLKEKKLVDCKTDTNVIASAIGWHL